MKRTKITAIIAAIAVTASTLTTTAAACRYGPPVKSYYMTDGVITVEVKPEIILPPEGTSCLRPHYPIMGEPPIDPSIEEEEDPIGTPGHPVLDDVIIETEDGPTEAAEEEEVIEVEITPDEPVEDSQPMQPIIGEPAFLVPSVIEAEIPACEPTTTDYSELVSELYMPPARTAIDDIMDELAEDGIEGEDIREIVANILNKIDEKQVPKVKSKIVLLVKFALSIAETRSAGLVASVLNSTSPNI